MFQSLKSEIVIISLFSIKKEKKETVENEKFIKITKLFPTKS